MKRFDSTSAKVITTQRLPSDLFTNGRTHFAITDDYYVDRPVIIPQGCTLEVKSGSLVLSAPGNSNLPNGIYILAPNQTSLISGKYRNLCITSRSDSKEEAKRIIYTPTMQNPFLLPGCRIHNGVDGFIEMKLLANCRIILPKDTARASLKITSDQSNTIQIDGKCNFQMHAENCRFERIWATDEGWSFNNRLKNNLDYTRLYSCIITAENAPAGIRQKIESGNEDVYDGDYNTNFFALCVGALTGDQSTDNLKSSECANCLIMRDCIVENAGLVGTMNVENCTFLFGYNVNDNFETIHCSNHSRIINCVFDGRSSESGIRRLKADIIDTANCHDVIIDRCTFMNFSPTSEDSPEDKKGTGVMITVKSHYYYDDNLPDPSENALSNFTGPQHGVIIRNCTFDLPDFEDYAIQLWNGVFGDPIERCDLNRQFTLIENNTIFMPKAHCFLNLMGFADYVLIKNNSGCVPKLVSVPATYTVRHPKRSESEKGAEERRKEGEDKDEKRNKPTKEIVNNIVHNIIIDGNVIRWRGNLHTCLDDENKEPEIDVYILSGSHIENLVLSNNISEKHLWNFSHEEEGLDDLGDGIVWSQFPEGNQRLEPIFPSGTIRVIGNQTIHGSLFRGRNFRYIWPNANVYFEGNVAEGLKTDSGPTRMLYNVVNGLHFVGRRFFDTTTQQLMVYNGGGWSQL